MDTLFVQYFAERESYETYFHGEKKGFMTFRVQGADKEEFYINHMFVAPDFRRQKVAWQMAERVFAIARNRGCKYVAGTIYRGVHGNSESMQAMLAFGFKIHSWDSERIVLTKGL